MHAARAALGLCALVSLQSGCVTEMLWEDFDDQVYAAHGPAPYAPPPPTPYALLQAVRTGDGAHHLLLRMSDGSDQHVVVERFAAPAPGDVAPVGTHAWPAATSDAEGEPARTWDDMPAGVPIAVAQDPPSATWSYTPREHEPDPAMAVMVDAPTGPEPGEPVVRLVEHTVVLTDEEGRETVLAEWPAPPPPRRAPPPPSLAPRRRGFARVVDGTVRVVLTPFALSLDAVAGAAVVAGCAVLFPVLPFILLGGGFHC